MAATALNQFVSDLTRVFAIRFERRVDIFVMLLIPWISLVVTYFALGFLSGHILIFYVVYIISSSYLTVSFLVSIWRAFVKKSSRFFVSSLLVFLLCYSNVCLWSLSAPISWVDYPFILK
jgi:hypothetical protein